MSFIERLLLMALLGAARDSAMAARVLGEPGPPGYYYVWGAAVFGDSDGWLPGLWVNGVAP